jgi:peptidoglycan hydrolase CwlO-like protein
VLSSFVLVLLLVLVLLGTSPASATAPSSSIVRLKADDADLAARSRSAVLELYSLDTRLTNAEHRLSTLRDSAARLRSERATLVRELRAARTDTRLSRIRLAARLRFIYEHRGTTSLDLMMGARSLEDAMTQLDEYDRIAASNLTVLLQVRTARHQLTHLSTELGSRERSLNDALAGAAREVAQLQQLTSARTAYVADLADRRSLDAQRISELTAAAQEADVARGLTAGANHYLTKPFSPVRLLSLVESIAPQAPVWQRE